MMIEAGPAALDCSAAKPMDCSLDSYSAAWVVVVRGKRTTTSPEPDEVAVYTYSC